MIPMSDFSTMTTQAQQDHETILKARLAELKRLSLAINEEHTVVEMELLVIAWRRNSGKQVVKKVLLYEDFFKKVRKAPRQEKAKLSLEEINLLASLKL